MRYKVLEACISNVAINAVSSIDGSPQVAYDTGSSICDSSEVAYVIKAGLHVAEKAMRILRNCETFGRTNHEWRRNIGSACRLENRGNKGNYESKHPVTVIDIEDISEVMLPSLSEEEKPHEEDEGKYVTSPDGIVSPLPVEVKYVVSEEVMEVLNLEIEEKSASLPPSCRINEIGDFLPVPGKFRTTPISECGPHVQNVLYGIYRPSPYGSHHNEHQISHERD